MALCNYTYTSEFSFTHHSLQQAVLVFLHTWLLLHLHSSNILTLVSLNHATFFIHMLAVFPTWLVAKFKCYWFFPSPRAYILPKIHGFPITWTLHPNSSSRFTKGLFAVSLINALFASVLYRWMSIASLQLHHILSIFSWWIKQSSVIYIYIKLRILYSDLSLL